MVDNKFDPTDANWYKKRWQIRFRTTGGKEYYTIYSNRDGNDGDAIQGDIARNPLNPQQFLTGRKDISTDTARYDKSMILTEKYGINSITFSSTCSRASRRLAFDYLGRPLHGKIESLNSMYTRNAISKLLKSRCTITLTDIDNNSRQIAIEPETGYTHIL
jgi:hypothetical protein